MWQRAFLMLLSISLHFDTVHPQIRWTCHRPHVEVTVSPLVNTTVSRSLVLYWSLETVSPGDHILLYPTDVSAQPLYEAVINTSSGWLDTGIQENRTGDSLAFTDQCLGYWAALKNGNNSQVIASSCLGTSPRWMEQNREALRNMSLRNMFLPGTHNSAAYIDVDGPFYETFVQKYTFNQDERVLNQLIYGARVLDLRVGHYPNTAEVWWSNHGIVRLRPLFQVLDDIILFVNMTREIVLLDIHHFPVGFQEDSRRTHQDLVRYLETYLGGYLLPPSLGYGAPLEQLWQTGKQIVLSYNYQGNIDTKLVWPRIVHKWGDVRSLPALQEYMARVMKRKYPYTWSAMAEITPSTVDVITGRLGSLRQLAHIVNPNVTQWFRGDWGEVCNIVSVDFLRSTGIVRAAIQWNLRRRRQSQCDQ